MLGRRGFFFARVADAKMQCIAPFLAITHKATVYDPTITKTRERHASVGIEITNSLPCRSSSDRRQLFKPVAPRPIRRHAPRPNPLKPRFDCGTKAFIHVRKNI